MTHDTLFMMDRTLDMLKKQPTQAILVLEDGTTVEGCSFGYESDISGEIVFCTGMVGYPEALTDASFAGQILVMTYPLIGNYGVPHRSTWESERIHVAALVVSDYTTMPSHAQSLLTLSEWLQQQRIPALEIKDTRFLTQHIRRHGTMPAKIIFDADLPFHNPNRENLVARVSTKRVQQVGEGDSTIALLDCGVKHNIVQSLVARPVRVVSVPWDYDLFAQETGERTFDFDGIVISNGPGNPKMVTKTIETLRKAMARNVPILGICLGHQLLALAADGDTHKLKFGHRSQNQPCLLYGTKRCYITTQNHGYAVGTLPPTFEPWFINANDNTNEGMRHPQRPWLSVQFHPEATPGPMDTAWIFDEFLAQVEKGTA